MGVRYIFGQDGAFRTEPVIVAKNITENGTYDPATEGADGYAPVVVNVEGGGGSSDLSTAEVTVVNNVTDSEEIAWEGSVIENNVCSSPAYITEGTPSVLTIILYKGSAQIKNQGFGRSVETSGSASYDSEADVITVTGDCTVTFSDGSLPPLP